MTRELSFEQRFSQTFGQLSSQDLPAGESLWCLMLEVTGQGCVDAHQTQVGRASEKALIAFELSLMVGATLC